MTKKKKTTKMQIILRVILVFVLLVCSVALCAYLKIFAIGWTRTVDLTIVCNVDYSADKIRLITVTPGSANAYAGCCVRKDGDNLYIKIKETLVGGFHQLGGANLELNGDFKNIKNIYIEDDKTTEKVYPKDFDNAFEKSLEKWKSSTGTDWKVINVK